MDNLKQVLNKLLFILLPLNHHLVILNILLLDLDKKEKLQLKFHIYYHFILINSLYIIISEVADFELKTINQIRNKLEKQLNKLVEQIYQNQYYQIRHLLLNSQYLTREMKERINKKDKKDTRISVWQLAYDISKQEGYPTNKGKFLDKCLEQNISTTNEALIYA